MYVACLKPRRAQDERQGVVSVVTSRHLQEKAVSLPACINNSPDLGSGQRAFFSPALGSPGIVQQWPNYSNSSPEPPASWGFSNTGTAEYSDKDLKDTLANFW